MTIAQILVMFGVAAVQVAEAAVRAAGPTVAAIEAALIAHIPDAALRIPAAELCAAALLAPPAPAPQPPAPPAAPGALAVNMPAMPVRGQGINIPEITLVPAGTQGTAIMASPPAATVVVTASRLRAWHIVLIVLGSIILLALLTIGIIHLAVGAKSAQVDAVKADTVAIKADAAFTRQLVTDTLPYSDGRRVHIPDLIEAEHDATRDEVRDQGDKTRKAVHAAESRIKARVSYEARRTRTAIGDAAKREQRIRVIILPGGRAQAVRQ